jgi:DNA-binding transcriptional regulator YiaG
MPTSYATRLKRARAALGLTQAAAATKWGISQQCLSAWERDHAQPKGLYKALVDHILHDSEASHSSAKQKNSK